MNAPTIPHIALEQFTLRRDYFNAQRRKGAAVGMGELRARLYPWVAIALRAGADPARMDPDLPAQLADRAGRTHGEHTARALLADDYCPLADALAELAIARDDAIDSMRDAKGAQAAQDLFLLARAMGAPAYHALPIIEGKAA